MPRSGLAALRAALACGATLLALAACTEILGDVEIVVRPSGDAGVTSIDCTPGERSCVGATWLECRAGVGWRPLRICASAALCSSEGCAEPACLRDELRCFAADPASPTRELQICNEDATGWTTLDSCGASECNASAGTCRDTACLATEAQCSGRELLACTSAAAWESVDQCPTSAQCDVSNRRCTATAAACSLDETQCNFGYWQRCKPAQDGFEDVEACVNSVHCLPQEGCLVPPCTPGAYRCVDAELQRCDFNRQWSRDQVCASPELCNANAKTCSTSACTPGDTQCNGSAYQTCVAGRRGPSWSTQSTCAAPSLCDVELGCIPPACNVGDYRCNGNNLERCSIERNAWVTVQSCTSASACNAPARRCDWQRCTPGEQRCDASGQLSRCRDDGSGFVLADSCGSVVACDPIQGCLGPAAACNAGDFRCNGQFLERCRGTPPTWRPEQRCDSSALCDAPGRTCRDAVCSPGAYRCTQRGSNGEVLDAGTLPGQASDLEVCNTGRDGFVLVETCGPSQTCDFVHGQCDDCKPFEKGCVGASRGICSNDGQEFEIEEDCSPTGRCVVLPDASGAPNAQCEAQ